MTSKLTACLDLLSRNSSARVTIMPSTRGVMIPSWLRARHEVALDIGYSMPQPIPDLRVSLAGVIATLSFGGVYRLCSFPWAAVVVQMSGEHVGFFSYPFGQAQSVTLVSFTASATVREPFKPRVIEGGKK